MGIIIAKVFPKEKEPETPEFILPTPRQIEIIKTTWEIPKANLSDSGEMILFRFLDDFPKNQSKFDAFFNVPLLSLRGTPGFRNHSDHIMKQFQKAIDCFDTEDPVGELKKLFTIMGTNHARRVTPKNSFFELRGIVLDVLTESCDLDKEGQEAWTVFYNDAVHILFNTFDEFNKAPQQKPLVY